MHDKTIRRVLAFFLIICVILIAVAVQSVRNTNRSADASDWVNHTHSVILQAGDLRTDLALGEASMHTYLLSNDTRDLAACREFIAKAAEQMNIVTALTRMEPGQKDEVATLEAQTTRRLNFIQDMVSAQQAGLTDKSHSMAQADAGGAELKDIERKINRLKNEELAFLTERDKAAFLQAQTTRWTVWIGVVLDVLLLGGVVWLIRDDLAARRRVAEALQEANEKLENRVRVRTAELASANSRLSSENLERQWANQALEHQLRYNQLIVDSISDLVLVLTVSQKISRINPAVVHLTGKEATALIHQPLSLIVQLTHEGGELNAPTIDPIAQALRDGRELRDQSALVSDRRGQTVSMLLTLCPLRDRDKVVGAVVTLRLQPIPPDSKA